MNTRRASGVLLHITSLPSAFGIGDFGPAGYWFADFLKRTGQSFWQILPLSPTSTSHGNSPYSSESGMAGNPILISPEVLVQDGFLRDADLVELADLMGGHGFQVDRVDYERVTAFKDGLFRKAFQVFQERSIREDAFAGFCARNRGWLDDFALFRALKRYFGGAPWTSWPAPLRDRDEGELTVHAERFAGEVQYEKFLQYIFFSQWGRLKNHCNENGIRIVGDIPIYVDHDSSDVWANREVFKLDQDGRPTAVAGVPPDYFSETGQLWGNPVYDWDRLRATNFAWWVSRVAHCLGLYDIVRLDHFRGLVAYWEVPAGDKTALHGRWVGAPVDAFLDTLLKRFPNLPIIAEDLGVITPDVREVMKNCGFPGMRVLAFAFGSDLATNAYAPHNHIPGCFVYTGTHDNNTIAGWFAEETTAEDRLRICLYLGREIEPCSAGWEFVRLALASVANTAIMPMQDILGLGAEARMNTPAKAGGENWRWRLSKDQITPDLVCRFAELTRLFGRG